MGSNPSEQHFVERLNSLNQYFLFAPEEFIKQLDQDEIIEILDQAMAPVWQSAMIAANIDTFEISFEDYVAYFKRLENLEKIKKTNGMAPLPIENKKPVGSSVGRSKAFPAFGVIIVRKTITIQQIV
jgi:hypothetical protein